MNPNFGSVFVVVLAMVNYFSCCYSKLEFMKYDHELVYGSRETYNEVGSWGSSRRLLASSSSSSWKAATVNVNDFKAKGDGKTDDTKAFKAAWKKACSTKNGVLVVPKNKKYLLKPISFNGPCKSTITMNILGTIIASSDRSNYENDRSHWIVFEDIENFKVQGGGIIDGNGNIWWKNSCKINKSLPCKLAPTAVTFNNCTNLRVENLVIRNAQQMHVSFQRSLNVRANNLMINSPGNSPNTDGIHVAETQNIYISKSTIKTGDDCISIVDGSKNVKATDITCGPGHGISIGSLGKDSSAAYVSDVYVNRAKLTGTTNGVRIKTWQGGSGYAKNVVFQNIVMQNVSNPIIIDQHYCDQNDPCKEQGSAVQVKNVVYKNIKGTSESEVPIKLDCSKNHPCQDIVLQDVNLVAQSDGDLSYTGKVKSSCKHVHLSYTGKVTPKCSSS